jgi:L-seryl-tRNA(Ser) seleniumtransferase
MTDPRRGLPSVDRLLQEPGVQALLAAAPRSVVVGAVREAVQAVRTGRSPVPESWADDISERIAAGVAPSLHPVINATGVVLHTNLGRAPLADAALAAVASVAGGYSTLEFDLATGTRGSRSDHCAGLLAGLTGAEDGLVVNNAAGALVLALNAAAEGREVLISRGELIEIGGSFRIPEILSKSGAVLREVGTTNRTHVGDYELALGPATGAILTVHRSNFEQTGFVASPAPDEVAALAASAGVPWLYDVGSGLLADLSDVGLTSEPRVPDAVAAGADVVLFSGDKLLGGPQAGCLVGRRTSIAATRRNPLARALRADKMTLAALEATLALYRDPAVARRAIPVLAMLTEPLSRLRERAAALISLLGAAACELTLGSSAVGGGAFPGTVLPTALVSLDPGSLGAAGLALRLRLGSPAVVARIEGGRVLLDPRTIPDEALPDLARAVQAALGSEP